MNNRGIYRRYLARVIKQYRERSGVRMYAELLLTLLAVVIFSVFAVRPTFTTIIALYNEIQLKEKTIEDMDKKINALATARSILEQEAERLELLSSAVPSAPRNDRYTREVQTVAQEAGGGVLSITTNDIVLMGNSSKETPYTVTVGGNYQTLIATLNGLESLRQQILKERVDIRTEDTNTNAFNITLTVSGQLLALP